MFQWAPTLEGECYRLSIRHCPTSRTSFNGHPPLRVNATGQGKGTGQKRLHLFQWAPTLEGECYELREEFGCYLWFSFNGHPPLRVNATVSLLVAGASVYVSMGTHP